MDQVDPAGFERMLYGGPWAWFQATLMLYDGTAVPGIFLRCPVCSSVVDWRDQGGHLRWHGISNARVIEEIEIRQRQEWNGLIVL